MYSIISILTADSFSGLISLNFEDLSDFISCWGKIYMLSATSISEFSSKISVDVATFNFVWG